MKVTIPKVINASIQIQEISFLTIVPSIRFELPATIPNVRRNSYLARQKKLGCYDEKHIRNVCLLSHFSNIYRIDDNTDDIWWQNIKRKIRRMKYRKIYRKETNVQNRCDKSFQHANKTTPNDKIKNSRIWKEQKYLT